MNQVDISSIARRPKDASTPAELWQYYDTRARQMLLNGFRWNQLIEWAPGFEGAAVQTFFRAVDGSRYVSFFVLPEHRGQGVMRALATATAIPIVTVDDCELSPILTRLDVAHVVAGKGILDSVEYDLVQEHYGDRRARRTKALWMNHIDEGLAIINWRGGSPLAARAFCLQPLLRADSDLAENFERVVRALRSVPDGHSTLALAMEYRSVVNAYQASQPLSAADLRLSPLADVNMMLAGSMVQRRKDFALYFYAPWQDLEAHEGNPLVHANYHRLMDHFVNWCDTLEVSEREFAELEVQLPGKPKVQALIGKPR